MRLSIIAALDRHRAIGRGNALPWQLPDDLARFKALTLGKLILMGRRTAESLGRALPKRRNLVLTRSGRVPFGGMEAVASIDAARGLAQADGADELCVIGGAELYALALPLADVLHLTHVHTAVSDADTWFPPFEPGEWNEVAREFHAPDLRHAVGFDFVDYARGR